MPAAHTYFCCGVTGQCSLTADQEMHDSVRCSLETLLTGRARVAGILRPQCSFRLEVTSAILRIFTCEGADCKGAFS